MRNVVYQLYCLQDPGAALEIINTRTLSIAFLRSRVRNVVYQLYCLQDPGAALDIINTRTLSIHLSICCPRSRVSYVVYQLYCLQDPGASPGEDQLDSTVGPHQLGLLTQLLRRQR